MKAVVFLMFVAFLGIVLFGCSQEGRKEAIDRTSNAMNVLNGGDKSAEQEHETPLVVQEHQKKERIRQNTKWTPENQKLFPIEYCQTQLKELDDNAKKLDVVSHTLATQLNRVTRTMNENA